MMNFLKTVSLMLFSTGLALFTALVVVGNELLAVAGLIVLLLGWLTAGIHSAFLELAKKIDELK